MTQQSWDQMIIPIPFQQLETMLLSELVDLSTTLNANYFDLMSTHLFNFCFNLISFEVSKFLVAMSSTVSSLENILCFL